MSIAIALLWGLVSVTGARAHEIQPSVADVEVTAEAMTLTIDLTLEAFLAGVDLEGLADTNEAENSERYDALRAEEPAALAADFRASWEAFREALTLRSGDAAIVADLAGVEVPDVGNTLLPRLSRITMTADLPAGQSPVIIGWDASLGALVLRQTGVEDGYTVFLENGRLSDPIPRVGTVDQSAMAAFVEYIRVGFDHIIPKGLDHILFVLGLFFLALRIRPLLWQVTAFTLAHTVTLALGALEIVRVPAEIVEPIIAASIVYVGIENVLSKGMTPWRPVIVFLFGLLHGLGFASVLSDFGLGSTHFVPKLIGFNVGVELGQLTVIAIAFALVGYWFGGRPWYKARIANPASILIALVGAWWVLERTVLG
jgi:hypothetical protein